MIYLPTTRGGRRDHDDVECVWWDDICRICLYCSCLSSFISHPHISACFSPAIYLSITTECLHRRSFTNHPCINHYTCALSTTAQIIISMHRIITGEIILDFSEAQAKIKEDENRRRVEEGLATGLTKEVRECACFHLLLLCCFIQIWDWENGEVPLHALLDVGEKDSGKCWIKWKRVILHREDRMSLLMFDHHMISCSWVCHSNWGSIGDVCYYSLVMNVF